MGGSTDVQTLGNHHAVEEQNVMKTHGDNEKTSSVANGYCPFRTRVLLS